jgi:hypothetical protein
MDVSTRKWWIKIGDLEEGPIDEDVFQKRLRAGEFPLSSFTKSNYMDDWKTLLSIVATDETFRRTSTTPPPKPKPASDD